MARIDVSEDLCKGCGLCVHYCPPRVIDWIESTMARHHPLGVFSG